MIATSKEKYFLCSQLDPPTPKKNSHMGIQALTICSQSTYLTNFRKKNTGCYPVGGRWGGGLWGKWPYCKGKKEAGIAKPI
jgi:hypothetical protein